jgi:hypothetical protein
MRDRREAKSLDGYGVIATLDAGMLGFRGVKMNVPTISDRLMQTRMDRTAAGYPSRGHGVEHFFIG